MVFLPFRIDAGGTYNTNFELEGKSVLIGSVNQKLTYVNGSPYAFNSGVPANDPNFASLTQQYWTGSQSAPGVLRLPYQGESEQRNNFRGQGFFGIDAGINKSFHITPRHVIRFSA